MASSSNSPCAACKFLRRKCQPECVFAPYFPPDHPQKFANVHKVFGASNVTKLLNELHPHQREDAVNTLAYEADMRLRDPVYGCVGVISLLQHQLRQLQIDLTSAKSELSKYQNHHLCSGHINDHNNNPTNGVLISNTATNHHHIHHELGMINLQLIGGGGEVSEYQQQHGDHHQLFPSSRDNNVQQIRAFDVKCTYDGAGGGLGQHMQYQQHRAAGSAGSDDRRTAIDPSQEIVFGCTRKSSNGNSNLVTNLRTAEIASNKIFILCNHFMIHVFFPTHGFIRPSTAIPPIPPA
ncbi:hypothetical protein OSB04_026709 [Centaurea solstitialis]|uniref:LOB domain-containing protein n=1 Tax=Centaurea solstitialis TaxID=347529 RepID=A0AA38SXF3_9ASTR|nr:hypothetical protein OSB04_026709 [Centaurea solstitialis]